MDQVTRNLTNQPLVSVIVPVYNTAKYLKECVNSILSQTILDIEVILVDDGSTDESGMIADQFAETDNRVSVLHKPNAGVSNTRNLGLSLAKGEWVTFVDSDDTVSVNYVEEMLNSSTPETDFCLCNFTLIKSDGSSFLYETFRPGKGHEESISNLYKTGWMCSAGVLFRKSFLINNQLHFPEHINYTEDVWLITRAIYYAHIINKTEKALYYYNIDNISSITHQSHNEKAESIRMDSMEETISFLRNHNSFNDCKRAVYWRILVWKSWIALYPQKYESFNDRFIEANDYIWSNPFLSLKMKVMLWLLSHRLFLLAKVLKHLYER